MQRGSTLPLAQNRPAVHGQARWSTETSPQTPADTAMSVVIPSFGRKAVLHETVLSLLGQSLLPAEIIISVPSLDHVEERTMALPRVRVIISQRGSCHQRNAAMRAVGDSCRYIAFFDDDMELDRDFLASMYDMMEANGDVVLATGNTLADGAKTGGISRDDARRIVRESEGGSWDAKAGVSDYWGASGGLMVCCRWLAEEIRFDERLALYGWLEDFEFAMQAMQFGRVVKFVGARCVHLAHRSGRVSGYRLGYSQIVNPCYFMKKGHRISKSTLLTSYWLPVLIRNGVSMLDRVRRERFIGNLRGLWMIVKGRVEPEGVAAFG